MKIFIRSLHAVDCGPLRDVVINFVSEGAHPVSILAGANGTGKTTALEIISALLDLIVHNSKVRPLEEEFTLSRNHGPNSTARILHRVGFAEIEITLNGSPVRVGYSATEPTVEASSESVIFYPSMRENGQLVHRSNKYSGVIKQIGSEIFYAEGKTLPFTFSTKDSDPHEQEHLPAVLFFPAYRVIMPNRGTVLTREQTRYNWVYRYENASDFNSSIDSILLWLEYASPEEYERVIRFLDSLDLGGKRFSVLRGELKALVTTKDGQQHFLEYLSSGEQHLITALLQLARRLTPHSIVLIDEIENALHPAYQYLFAELLTRMQTIVPFQLIVTTHAPAMLDAFGTEAVRLLSAN